MAYILKNNGAALINTTLTDTGRFKLAEGSFKVAYFQVGDSEISYNTLPTSYNQADTKILQAFYNSQNSKGKPESNKQNVKYPFYLQGTEGNTYGIPFMDSTAVQIFNAAAPRGFFSGDTTENKNWKALTNNSYVINSNYVVDLSQVQGGSKVKLIYKGCNPNVVREPKKGDIITIYFDGFGEYNCTCEGLPTPTPTPTPSITPSVTPTEGYFPTPTPTPTETNKFPCESPTPTPSPTETFCPTPTPSNVCPQPPDPYCSMFMFSCYPILTYRIVDVCLDEITLDRELPDFGMFAPFCYARTLIYPQIFTEIYDSVTPLAHWNTDVVNYESICAVDEFDVKVWNMNIPWSENPAGLNSNFYKGYEKFGSTTYLGTKEFLGYASSKGQEDSSPVYIVNSLGDKYYVTPEQQKAIAILHYSNNTIDNFYGEKFALQPFNPLTQNETSGFAREFKITIPWIMWHKNPDCCQGQTFWVDPPGFDNLNLFKVHYLTSNKNDDMNNPGIRYYNLWDTNPNLIDGYPSRVGKVFPDSKIVIFDDEEIIAAMSYKSNRNWTLPAPRLNLVTPNTCSNDSGSLEGIMTGSNEYMHVTYRLSNNKGFTNSLHCNYYINIPGPNICNSGFSQNVAVRFGPEFNCLNYGGYSPTTTTTTMYNTTTTTIPYHTTTTTQYSTTTTTICPPICEVPQGFVADTFEVICQKVEAGKRPDPDEWKIIDFTSLISSTTYNGYITQNGLTGTTFVITKENYEEAPYYDLGDYVDLTPANFTGTSLNFGDEYYFYGILETNIEATIYEMKYKVNLPQTQFIRTSNPSWTPGTPIYVSEIGLFDEDKNLLIMSKLQNPVLRSGIQQFLVALDF